MNGVDVRHIRDRGPTVRDSSTSVDPRIHPKPRPPRTGLRDRQTDRNQQQVIHVLKQSTLSTTSQDCMRCGHLSNLRPCMKLLNLEQLLQFQAHAITTGLIDDPFVVGNLLESFLFIQSNPNAFISAVRLFSHASARTTFMWNSLIRSYVSNDLPCHAISLFDEMLQRGTSLNNYTFPPVLKAFSQLQAFREGGPAHSLVIKLGFDSDVFVQNALVHFYGVCERVDVAQQLFDEIVEPNVVAWTSLLSGYAKLGDLEFARRVFDVMPEKNLVSWSAMISGYVQGGQFVEALRLFHEMQVLKICPSLPVLVSILIAIAEMGALQEGIWVHGFIERNGLGWGSNLRASLVHMYMKCGDVVSAWQAFDKMPDRGLDVWNAMIVGLGLHGQGEEALRLFSSMVSEGLQPDDITFIGVLCGCSHARLVEKGLECFASMNTVYNVLPKVEHYSCVVDLLGRAGLIKEALEVIQSMPMEANGRVWGSLFGACRNHGDAELGEIVGKHLIKLEPHRAGRYVLLANIYASMDRWEDAIKVRELMKQNGVELEPGCSLIEVDGVVHEFLVGDKVHPQTSDIYRKLDEMVKLCRCEGYVPNTKHVLFDISEEEKEGALCWHSEKLAIAFALISTDPKAVIRVVKNLRICGDCHSMMKVVSKVYDREIVIRDRSRFHHFKQGRCSCMDYW